MIQYLLDISSISYSGSFYLLSSSLMTDISNNTTDSVPAYGFSTSSMNTQEEVLYSILNYAIYSFNTNNPGSPIPDSSSIMVTGVFMTGVFKVVNIQTVEKV